MINSQDLFLKTGNPILDSFDFLKRFITLYDLLIGLLNEEISSLKV